MFRSRKYARIFITRREPAFLCPAQAAPNWNHGINRGRYGPET